MIIDKTPDNIAVLGNVQQTHEFGIKASSKAFSILSSGLYANKIRAVIRELSCNAWDSHVAAGKPDQQFELHLPVFLEPYFSVRDYGTGMSYHQVITVFTTYFASDKDRTNALIGGLGLGAKSPFSVTDNFTVTSWHDGTKSVYTAFINDEGVPSLALMMEEESSEPTGVEVRFSVENNSDFYRYQSEASDVFKYFPIRPMVTGPSEFSFRENEYVTLDIVPGVHVRGNSSRSVAVMGNIEYPIEIPKSNPALDAVAYLLQGGLVMHFDIGELDFQASREGLSYIPQTINAIQGKLEAVHASLVDHVAKILEPITCFWERTEEALKLGTSEIFRNAVKTYVANNQDDFGVKPSQYHWHTFDNVMFSIDVKKTEEDFNIKISAATFNGLSVNPVAARVDHATGIAAFTGDYSHPMQFVINDTKHNPLRRFRDARKTLAGTIRYSDENYNGVVNFLSKADATKEMDLDGFFATLNNPPESMKFLVSELPVPEKKPVAKTTAVEPFIFRLVKRESHGYKSNSNDLVWRESSKRADDYTNDADITTCYYLPLSGLIVQSEQTLEVRKYMRGLYESGILTGKEQVYGVRKGSMSKVESSSKWVNLIEYAEAELIKITASSSMHIFKNTADFSRFFSKTDLTDLITNPDSPYLKFKEKFDGISVTNKTSIDFTTSGMQYILGYYDMKQEAQNIQDEMLKFQDEMTSVLAHYPLMSNFRGYYSTDSKNYADYINGIDLLNNV